MAYSLKVLGAVALCLAQASCSTQPSLGVPPGNYSMTVTPDIPGPHPACGGFGGKAELSFREGVAITDLFSPLQLIVDSNGGVSGTGMESMTGYSARSRLTGKRTNSGYEGTLEAEKYSIVCTGSWVITRHDGSAR